MIKQANSKTAIDNPKIEICLFTIILIVVINRSIFCIQPYLFEIANDSPKTGIK